MERSRRQQKKEAGVAPKRMFAAALVVVALAAACAQEGGGRPTILDVTAVDFGFQGAPEEIDGGVVDLTFTNAGDATHEFGVINAEGVSTTDFKEGLSAVVEGKPFPEFMDRGAAVFEADPGEEKSTSFTLPEGDYFLFCALTDEPGGDGEDQPQGKNHMDLGMLQPLRVTDANERELDADAGAFVAKDYSFELPTSLEPGQKTYVFRNDGPVQWHHMELMVFPEGTSEAEAIETFAKLGELEQGEPPPEGLVMPEEAASAGVFSPGLGQTIDLDLQAGRTYLALCFISDKEGGPPHAFGHKMVKAFTVPD
jgi:hypothetical protein